MKSPIRTAGIALAVAALAALIWINRDDGGSERPDRAAGRVAVEVAPVTTGSIVDRREITGTLEAQNAFTVAPKIGGSIELIHFDIGDTVERNGILVELDDDEARQAVAEAQASLLLARAEQEQAESEAELAQREFERTRTLAQRQLASQSDLDTARARAAAERSRVSVAEARVSEREAALGAARVRLSYTEVRARWPEANGEYVVGERMVSRGDTVSANEPLLTLLAIDPLKAVVHASERDYPMLARGQATRIVADAMPRREFEGEIARLAPRFDQASRQARVEVRVPNVQRDLKPGMFVTVYIAVDEAEDVTLVPLDAITRHGGREGVFLAREDGEGGHRAQFVAVETGIESDHLVEIREPSDLSGRVITLGQQLLEDDGAIQIAAERDS